MGAGGPWLRGGTAREELVEALGVDPDVSMPVLSFDLQRGAEEAVVTHEEVRRAHDATASAFSPVGEDPSASIGTRAGPRLRSTRRRLSTEGSLMSFPRSNSASRTARLARSPHHQPARVRVVHQVEGREGRVGELAGVKATEQIWCDLAPQVIDLLGDVVCVERLVVHELERPGPNAEHEVVASGSPNGDGGTA